MIYFENVTLTLHNVSIHKNHASTITSVIAAKQTVINEVFVCFFFNKIINFIYSVDKIFLVIKLMDFNKTEPK